MPWKHTTTTPHWFDFRKADEYGVVIAPDTSNDDYWLCIDRDLQRAIVFDQDNKELRSTALSLEGFDEEGIFARAIAWADEGHIPKGHEDDGLPDDGI